MTGSIPLRSIDLFAGCGGLSLGLHNAGWQGMFAIERDPMAFQTLDANLVADGGSYDAYPKWPDWLPVAPTDIVDLLQSPAARDHLRSLRGTVNLVAGGPPCQGFSAGGARNGLDERNQLVQQELDLIGLVRPDVAIVENVEGIARVFRSRPGSDEASVADQVVAALVELGYRAAYDVVDASHFGVPQARRRAIIIGFREDLGIDPSAFFDALRNSRQEFLTSRGLPFDRAVSAGEALNDLCNPRDRITSPDSEKFETSRYKSAASSFALRMRREIPDGAVPDSHRYTKHGERVQALYANAHATQPKGRLSKQFLLDSGTKKDKKVLIDPAKPVSTITTHPDEFIHFEEARNVTVREMARLQSFPDDFRFLGRYTINGPRRKFDVARCSQVGNAVPPLLAEAIGVTLGRLLR